MLFFWLCGYLLNYGRAISGTTSLRKIDSPPSSYILPVAPQLGVEPCDYFPFSIFRFCVVWICGSLMGSVKMSANLYVQLLHCVQKTLSDKVPQLLALTVFFQTSPQWTLDLVWRRYDIDAPFRTEHPSTFYSLHFGQLWPVLIMFYCKKKLFWRGLR